MTDDPTTGTAAMTAMWATTDVTLNNNNVLATVPITVVAGPAPTPTTNPTQTTRPLPKRLRKAKKVHSLTPAVCKVKERKVVVLKSGVCKLKGKKNGHKVIVKVTT